MDRSPSSAETVRFGVFELDLRAGELRKQGIRIRLQDQPLLILQALLERPGEIVTREELKAKIWPADTFVDFDHGMYSAMKRLRDALGDSAENPRFVETLARRGYRFIAPVDVPSQTPQVEVLPAPVPVELPSPDVSKDVLPPAPKRKISIIFVALGALGAVAILCFVFNVGGLRNWILGKPSIRSFRSLAVLPLANLSPDPAQDYFADEMTEELITQFSKLGDLKVISRTSVMQYKGTRKPLPQIARELGVDAIVEGAVQLSGQRVRITAQLVDAATDKHIWAEDYDRELSDVLLLQSEVARDIAAKIDLQLTPQQRRQLEKQAHTVIPEAYESYLLGRYYWNKRTADGLQKSGTYFHRAIQQDPNYALAYAGLADYYAFLTLLGGPEIMPPRKAMADAKAAAERALKLDDSLAEAHASMGHVLHNYDWDWSGAEREFKRAIELNPNYSIVHHWYAHELMQMGRTQDSLAQATRAVELDPLSLFVNNGLARQYYLSRQYDQAIAQCQKGLEIDPGYVPARIQLGLALGQKGMLDQAISEFEQARDQAANYALTGEGNVSAQKVPVAPGGQAVTAESPAGKPEADLPAVHAMLGYAYAKAGRATDARKELQKLTDSARLRYVAPSWMAIVNIPLGDKDQAFFWLEKSYQDRSEHMLYLKVEPLIDPLRSDPRFASLLKRVGLEP
jgi:TolB-like protein/DNA-binding winged helix-turn-helix (wHTH) protein/Tfp pilus assembly protein PilF